MENYYIYYLVILFVGFLFVLNLTTKKEKAPRSYIFQTYRYEYPKIIGSLLFLLVMWGLYITRQIQVNNYKIVLFGCLMIFYLLERKSSE